MATGATVSLQWFVYIEITLLSKHSLESGCAVSGTAALQADYSININNMVSTTTIYNNHLLFYFLSFLQFFTGHTILLHSQIVVFFWKFQIKYIFLFKTHVVQGLYKLKSQPGSCKIWRRKKIPLTLLPSIVLISTRFQF